jgi:hypothetical protein
MDTQKTTPASWTKFVGLVSAPVESSGRTTLPATGCEMPAGWKPSGVDASGVRYAYPWGVFFSRALAGEGRSYMSQTVTVLREVLYDEEHMYRLVGEGETTYVEHYGPRGWERSTHDWDAVLAAGFAYCAVGE